MKNQRYSRVSTVYSHFIKNWDVYVYANLYRHRHFWVGSIKTSNQISLGRGIRGLR